jgi:pyruvate,water dikinase
MHAPDVAHDARATKSHYLVALPDVGLADIARVGGKAAGLGELLRSGLPVPPGYCLTTAAYHRFIAQVPLVDPLRALAAGAAQLALPVLQQTAAALQARMVAAPVPPDLVNAIDQAYRALGAPPVAVRSSATTEDLPEASFAGQQDSFLNVIGLDALLAAIRRCWASLWNVRAIQYRAQLGLNQEAAAMGVVIQALIPADVAGVLFTANPRTGDRTELVVNASFGLGEAIVSGAVTPDLLVLDKTTLAHKQAVPGAKEVSTVPAAGGGTTVVRQPGRKNEWALPAAALTDLAALAGRAEAHFGMPLDIEWALAGGRPWLLQARPITRLPPPPLRDVRWVPPAPGSVWVRRQVAENLPEPLSPLFDELYVRQGLEHALADLLAFFNIPWFRLEDVADRPFFTTVNGYAYQRGNFRWRWTTFPRIIRASVASWSPLLNAAVPHWRDAALPAYRATVRHWQQLAPAGATSAELLAGVRDLAGADATYWYACALVMAVAKTTDALLDRFLAVALPGRGLTSGHFLRGYPSPTLDAAADLESIAACIRASSMLSTLVVETAAERLPAALAGRTEGQAVLAALQAYLARYGHQVYNLDFVEPTQADNPRPVLLSLQALVQHPARSLREHQAALVRERDALVGTVVQTLDPLRRAIFRRLLGWAQRYGPYREQALFAMGSAWPVLRRLALELGRRLVQAGVLTQPEDVFYLETAEIAAGLAASGPAPPDLGRVAQARRELREARRRLHPPAAVPPASGMQIGPFKLSPWETQRRNATGGRELQGFAVSPGRATAPASVVRSPADFGAMAPGTVLVCPTTTPAWTPLFAQAAALVTDVGGILAHGSIVAREYGIPAVLGTGTATQRIRPGQVITVDGDRGLVELGGVRSALSVPPRKRRALGFALALAALGLGLWRRRHRGARDTPRRGPAP